MKGKRLLTMLVSLILVLSIVGGAGPLFLNSTKAFADHDNDEKNVVEHKYRTKLDVKDDNSVEMKVVANNLTLADGSYDAIFSCGSPDVERRFHDSFKVEHVEGKFETRITLDTGTYNHCMLTVHDTTIRLDSFTIVGDDVKQHRHERMAEIVSIHNGRQIHDVHIRSNPASPGDYKPGLEYILEAEGTAIRDDDVERDAELTVNAAVWKSTKSLVIFDILEGTAEIQNENYNIHVGYGLLL